MLTAREADGTVRQEVRTVTLERERSARGPGDAGARAVPA